jgi:hypothetical protein
VVERIRHSPDYTTTNTYWLGGVLGLEGRWQWLSGLPMTFTGQRQQTVCCCFHLFVVVVVGSIFFSFNYFDIENIFLKFKQGF